MKHIGLPELLFVGGFAFWFFVLVIPFWQIFKKAGFSPWFSLLMSVPLLNAVMLYFLAFASWPNRPEISK
jgi:hypothetical protein